MSKMNCIKAQPVKLITARDAKRVALKMTNKALKGDPAAASVVLMLHGGLFTPAPTMNPMC